MSYKGTQTDQSSATGDSTTTRNDRDTLVDQATQGRMNIQFAADAEWPHTNTNNTPIRKLFQLPATRAFVG